MVRAVALAALLWARIAAASGFEFTDFARTKELFLVRDAFRSKNALRLTEAARFQAGAAWYKVKQPVAGGFETAFTFRFASQDTGPNRGADGSAFVVQNEARTAVGGFDASAGFMRSRRLGRWWCARLRAGSGSP